MVAAEVKRILLHEFRHSHASYLINLGVSPLIVAQRLGHSDVATTLNTYSHLYPSKQAEALAFIEKDLEKGCRNVTKASNGLGTATSGLITLFAPARLNFSSVSGFSDLATILIVSFNPLAVNVINTFSASFATIATKPAAFKIPALCNTDLPLHLHVQIKAFPAPIYFHLYQQRQMEYSFLAIHVQLEAPLYRNHIL